MESCDSNRFVTFEIDEYGGFEYNFFYENVYSNKRRQGLCLFRTSFRFRTGMHV